MGHHCSAFAKVSHETGAMEIVFFGRANKSSPAWQRASVKGKKVAQDETTKTLKIPSVVLSVYSTINRAIVKERGRQTGAKKVL